MVDFNGSGGLAGFNPFGGMATGPAMSAGQINSSMGFNPNANPYDPFAQSGGFGSMTDYYSGLGAAYGRATGGFGGGGGGGGGGDIWSGGTSAFNPYGFGANPGGFSPSPNYPGGTGGDGGGGGGGGDWTSGMTANDWNSFVLSGGAYGSPGSSGRNNLANLMWQGTSPQAPPLGGGGGGGGDAGGSSSYPYSGNPYYLPQPMQGGAATWRGGGFGQPGSGGFPGTNFGMGIGTINGNGAPNLPPAYGVMNNGGMGYGFGGLTDAPTYNELVNGNAGG